MGTSQPRQYFLPTGHELSVIVQPTLTEGLLYGGHCARCWEGAVKDAALCLEAFAVWWGRDRKTGVSAGGSEGAPPLALGASFPLEPEEKKKQPEGKVHPVFGGPVVSPALKTTFQGEACI